MVRSSAGKLDQSLKIAWARRKISFDILVVRSFEPRLSGVAFVGERKLVPQVIEAVVDGRRREHEDLGLDALPDDGVHQFLVARFAVPCRCRRCGSCGTRR